MNQWLTCFLYVRDFDGSFAVVVEYRVTVNLGCDQHKVCENGTLIKR